MGQTRVEELRERIADLKKRWPAHSVPPALLEQLDELEEELDKELKRSGDLGEGLGESLGEGLGEGTGIGIPDQHHHARASS